MPELSSSILLVYSVELGPSTAEAVKFCSVFKYETALWSAVTVLQGHQYGAATVITGDLPFEVPEGWNSTSPEEGVTVLTPGKPSSPSLAD